MIKKEGLKVKRELAKLERNLGGIRNLEQAARRRLRDRHQEGAHRGHRGQPPRHPGDRRRRHQLRSRRHRLRDPRQRRRHPLREPDVPHRRRRGRSRVSGCGRASRPRPVRPPAPRPAKPPAAPQPKQLTPEEQAAKAAEQQKAPRRRRGRRSASVRRRLADGQADGRPTAEAPPNAEPEAPSRRRSAGRPEIAAEHRDPGERAMAEFSAKDVAALRKATGAGMMDCKNALEETDGDLEAAMDWLRAKGLAKARQARATARPTEGAVDVARRRQRRRDRRAQLQHRLRRQGRRLHRHASRRSRKLVAAQGDGDVAALAVRGLDRRRARSRSSPRKLGENVALGRVVRFETDRRPRSTRYKHIQNDRGTIGVLVELGGVDPPTPKAQRGRARDRAAHRRSPRPRYLTRDDVPADVVEQRAGGHRGEEPQRGQARGQARQDRSRAGSTAFYKDDRARSSRRSVKDPKVSDRQARRGPRRRRHAPAVRPRQGRRGVASAAMSEERRWPRASTAGWCSSCRVRRSPTPTIGLRHRRRRRAADRRGGRRRARASSASRSRSSSAAATSGGA